MFLIKIVLTFVIDTFILLKIKMIYFEINSQNVAPVESVKLGFPYKSSSKTIGMIKSSKMNGRTFED